ncbi:putative collagen-binding domain-containing protein [Pedobacter panaciterrae]
MLDRIPDQGLILGDNPKDGAHCSATRANDGHYAFIYTPTGRKLNVNTAHLKGKQFFKAKWFNPRNGVFSMAFKIDKKPQLTFTPPTSGDALDWVLILEAG